MSPQPPTRSYILHLLAYSLAQTMTIIGLVFGLFSIVSDHYPVYVRYGTVFGVAVLLGLSYVIIVGVAGPGTKRLRPSLRRCANALVEVFVTGSLLALYIGIALIITIERAGRTCYTWEHVRWLSIYCSEDNYANRNTTTCLNYQRDWDPVTSCQYGYIAMALGWAAVSIMAGLFGWVAWTWWTSRGAGGRGKGVAIGKADGEFEEGVKLTTEEITRTRYERMGDGTELLRS